MAKDPSGNWIPDTLPPNPMNPPLATAGNNDVTGAFDNPNGSITPPNRNAFSFYVKDQSTPVEMWAWSVSQQIWFPVMS